MVLLMLFLLPVFNPKRCKGKEERAINEATGSVISKLGI